MRTTDISAQVAFDTQSVENLRAQAKRDPESALKSAARQFEALFMNMLLKSMRDTVPQDGMLESDQTRLYTSMLDQQLAQALSGRGLGLADVMVKQLSRAISAETQPASVTVPPTGPGAAPASPSQPAPRAVWEPSERREAVAPGAASSVAAAAPHAGAREFVNRLWPHAVEASRQTGIPPHFMIGQAALESGWGRREIRAADGTASHNLFGIKAGRGWSGPVAETMTTEYVNGMPEKSVERFRAYSSYAEAFRDYANVLRTSPRYAGVLERARDAEGYARGLQQAGYATDPMYADKLLRILNGATLRASLSS